MQLNHCPLRTRPADRLRTTAAQCPLDAEIQKRLCGMSFAFRNTVQCNLSGASVRYNSSEIRFAHDRAVPAEFPVLSTLGRKAMASPSCDGAARTSGRLRASCAHKPVRPWPGVSYAVICALWQNNRPFIHARARCALRHSRRRRLAQQTHTVRLQAATPNQ